MHSWLAERTALVDSSGIRKVFDLKPLAPVAEWCSFDAWSGRGRIAKVEVSADGGKTWALAQLHGPVLDRAFTRFSIPWQWQGKKTVLMSRATDELGHVQPTRSAWKSRYAAHSFNHYNAIQAWEVGKDGRVENTYA